MGVDVSIDSPHPTARILWFLFIALILSKVTLIYLPLDESTTRAAALTNVRGQIQRHDVLATSNNL